jgi:hypothetical protein
MLENKKEALSELKKPFDENNEKKYKKWYNETELIFEDAFERESEMFKEFYRIEHPAIFCASTGETDWIFENKIYQDNLIRFESTIEKAIFRLNNLSQKPKTLLNDKTISQSSLVTITNQNNNTNTNNINIDISNKVSFQKIKEDLSYLEDEKREKAKKIVDEFEKEIKSDTPNNTKLINHLKKGFEITTNLGLKLLPYVIEHWDKIIKIGGL